MPPSLHTDTMSYPFNPWTRDEEARLLASSTSGIPMKTIAERHNRTPNAIRLRLERITLNHILEGKSAAEALKLTGLPMKAVQTSGNPDSGRAAAHPMFTTMVSRNDLKSLQQVRKNKDLVTVVERIASSHVTPAAEKGLTWVILSKQQYDGIVGEKLSRPMYVPTLEELVAPLQAKFPGVTVAFTEELADAGRGLFTKVQQLVIDWS